LDAAIITEGEFTGWQAWSHEAFEFKTAGPMYFRYEDDVPVAAMRALPKHMNAGSMVHGGCLMSFADFALFVIAKRAMDNQYGVTIAFTSEFLSPAREGDLLEARGEVLRTGRSLLFVRGLITANDEPCLNFSGTIKRVKATS
jgi:uncharacterized protein (TIGR00369 family)